MKLEVLTVAMMPYKGKMGRIYYFPRIANREINKAFKRKQSIESWLYL